ncbi:MAG TPA: DUF1559 domain-containing protein [Pirellulales bacterium]|nr:DUF1559 domain-containing protein [Pirellulales bacterium]
MDVSFLQRLLACSDAHARPATWLSRLDPSWVVAGIFSLALIVVVCIRPLRRPAVLVPFGMLAALILLLVPAIAQAREAGRRTTCTCNLKQIGVAMHNYHDLFGSFPPAYIADERGRPMHSWRVLLLPFLEGKQVYDQYDFNEPWDGPHNRLLADKMPAVYHCPSDDESKPGETSYAAIVGPQTMWPGDETIPLTDVKDGTENTLAIVEAAGNGIHWMQPRDVPVSVAKAGINNAPGLGICSRHPQVAIVLYADGSVHTISQVVSPETLQALFTRAGGDTPGAIWFP